jgi:membrane protein YdbS with pleckstrin-like domain
MTTYSFNEILGNEESITWTGRPSKLHFLFWNSELWQTVGVSAILICVFTVAELTTAERMFPWYFIPMLVLIMGISSVIVFAKRYMEYVHVAFALTNQRALFRYGILVDHYKTIDLHHLTKVEVDRNPVQALFNTGNVRFFTTLPEYDEYGMGTTPDRWESVQAPYEVLKKVQEAAKG